MTSSGQVEVVLLIACYNGRSCIGQCLDSLLKSGDVGVQAHIVVVDNASSDGSADFVAGKYSSVNLVRLPGNLGFTGAINAGWRFARERFAGAKYFGILNQDIIVKEGWLAALVGHLEENPAVAAAQPKILLWPRKDCFNTAGNRSHFLGFGLVTAYGERDVGQFDVTREIDFPSGAATLVRADAVENEQPMEDLFFLYLEDAELGWRLRQRGHRVEYVPAGVVWHEYSFRHDYAFYFFLERNRWYLLAMYYKVPTLLLLSPAILAMEMGQIYFAWRNGALRQKLRAMGFFLQGSNLSELLRRRAQVQRRRKISDRQFTRNFTGCVDLPELRSAVLRRVGNPLLGFYWRLVRPLIFW